jgi:hypothetical protein
MPHRRDQVEGLAARGTYWNFLICVLQLTHKTRFPSGRSFGADLPLIVTYGAVLLNYSRAKVTRATDLARSLNMPRESARRYLRELFDLGLVDRDGPKYRPGKKVARRHRDGAIMTDALLRQMVVSLERFEQAK